MCAPKLSPSASRSLGAGGLARQVLAEGSKDHFFGDDAGASKFILGDELAVDAPAQDAIGRTGIDQPLGGDIAVVLGLHRPAGNRGNAARGDPGLAHAGQALPEIDVRIDLSVRPGGIIDAHRRLAGSLSAISRNGTRMSGWEDGAA